MYSRVVALNLKSSTSVKSKVKRKDDEQRFEGVVACGCSSSGSSSRGGRAFASALANEYDAFFQRGGE